MTGQEPSNRCGSCGSVVPLLVDDGPLCMACDALLYPTPGASPIPAALAVAAAAARPVRRPKRLRVVA